MEKFKYKCNNCGKEFVGDLSTTECPQCGSQDLSTKSDFPQWIWMVLVGVVLFIVMTLLLSKCSTEGKIIGRLDVTAETLEISVDGIDERKLGDYYILASYGSSSHLTFHFINGRSRKINKTQLIPGTTYTFDFVDNNGEMPKNFEWEGVNSYYHDYPPAPPYIDTVLYSAPNYNNQCYGLVKIVLKDDSTQRGIEYYLDDNKQYSPEFTNISCGTHQVKVINNKNLSHTITINLPVIQKVPDRITIEQMNVILTRLHNNEITLGKARTSISPKKDIKLKKTIDGARTLYEVMQRTRQEGAYSYKVINCSYDENNKIVQGTLEIVRK